jgi:hypothetical protein
MPRPVYGLADTRFCRKANLEGTGIDMASVRGDPNVPRLKSG